MYIFLIVYTIIEQVHAVCNRKNFSKCFTFGILMKLWSLCEDYKIVS